MVDFGIVSAFGAALNSIKTITDIASTITNAKLKQELNGKIADLQGEILTARQQMLGMQEEYEHLLQENKELKNAAAPREKPKVQWGCYRFDDEDGLFCTACYDTKGKKILTTRVNTRFRQCPVCKAVLGSG